jgi:hypothetical protein
MVPAYSEAASIATSLTSVLCSEDLCGDWRVLLVDERPRDATVAIVANANREAAVEADEQQRQFISGAHWPAAAAGHC